MQMFSYLLGRAKYAAIDEERVNIKIFNIFLGLCVMAPEVRMVGFFSRSTIAQF